MVLWVIAHLDLQDLPIHDVWCLLLNRIYLSSALITHLDLHFNVDESASVDVFRLQKASLNRKHVEVT